MPSFQIIGCSYSPGLPDMVLPSLRAEWEIGLSSKNNQALTGCNLKASHQMHVTNSTAKSKAMTKQEMLTYDTWHN